MSHKEGSLMTVSHLSILPEKSVQFCDVTGDFEVRVNGHIIGYAATELRGTQLANEYVYALLSARGHLYADIAQDDADALLAFHLAESPVPLDAPQDADGATLPPSHPIRQLVREAAWLAAHLPLAA
jgi:hypothetical protein